MQTTIRVRFPDNHTLEATFHPSEKIESLVALLEKVVAKPGMPFYICTFDASDIDISRMCFLKPKRNAFI